MEALAKTEILVFDKTGTLTKEFSMSRKSSPKGLPVKNSELVAYAESYSSHPISNSLRQAEKTLTEAAFLMWKRFQDMV